MGWAVKCNGWSIVTVILRHSSSSCKRKDPGNVTSCTMMMVVVLQLDPASHRIAVCSLQMEMRNGDGVDGWA